MILYKYAQSVSFYENEVLHVYSTYTFDELKETCFDRICKERGIKFNLIRTLYIYDQIKQKYIDLLKKDIISKYNLTYSWSTNDELKINTNANNGVQQNYSEFTNDNSQINHIQINATTKENNNQGDYNSNDSKNNFQNSYKYKNNLEFKYFKESEYFYYKKEEYEKENLIEQKQMNEKIENADADNININEDKINDNDMNDVVELVTVNNYIDGHKLNFENIDLDDIKTNNNGNGMEDSNDNYKVSVFKVDENENENETSSKKHDFDSYIIDYSQIDSIQDNVLYKEIQSGNNSQLQNKHPINDTHFLLSTISFQNHNTSSQHYIQTLEENLTLEDEMFKFIENDLSIKTQSELNLNEDMNIQIGFTNMNSYEQEMNSCSQCLDDVVPSNDLYYFCNCIVHDEIISHSLNITQFNQTYNSYKSDLHNYNLIQSSYNHTLDHYYISIWSKYVLLDKTINSIETIHQMLDSNHNLITSLPFTDMFNLKVLEKGLLVSNVIPNYSYDKKYFEKSYYEKNYSSILNSDDCSSKSDQDNRVNMDKMIRVTKTNNTQAIHQVHDTHLNTNTFLQDNLNKYILHQNQNDGFNMDFKIISHDKADGFLSVSNLNGNINYSDCNNLSNKQDGIINSNTNLTQNYQSENNNKNSYNHSNFIEIDAENDNNFEIQNQVIKYTHLNIQDSNYDSVSNNLSQSNSYKYDESQVINLDDDDEVTPNNFNSIKTYNNNTISQMDNLTINNKSNEMQDENYSQFIEGKTNLDLELKLETDHTYLSNLDNNDNEMNDMLDDDRECQIKECKDNQSIKDLLVNNEVDNETKIKQQQYVFYYDIYVIDIIKLRKKYIFDELQNISLSESKFDLDEIPYELESHVPLGMSKTLTSANVQSRIVKFLLRLYLMRFDIYHLNSKLYQQTYYDLVKHKIVYRIEVCKVQKWEPDMVTFHVNVQPAIFDYDYLLAKDLFNQKVVSIHYLLPKFREVYIYSQIGAGEQRDVCHEYMIYNFGWYRNHYMILSKMSSVVLEYLGTGLYKMPNCLILKDMPTFNLEKTRRYLVPIIKLFNTLMKDKGIVSFELDTNRIEQGVLFDQKAFEHIYYNKIPDLTYKLLITDINGPSECSKYSDFFPRNFFVTTHHRLRKYEEVVGSGTEPELKREDEELKRKRNNDYVDLIEEEDIDADAHLSSSHSSSESEEEEHPALRQYPRQVIVNSKKEKAFSFKIDELFTKSRRPNKYSSMKINTIRDEDHTREEMLRDVNRKWTDNYNESSSNPNVKPKTYKVNFTAKGDKIRYFDIEDMQAYIDFETKSEMFKYFVYN